MPVHNVKIDPTPHNVLSSRLRELFEIAELRTTEWPPARNIAINNTDHTTILQNEFSLGLAALIFAMDMHGLMLIRVEVYHQTKILIKLRHPTFSLFNS